MSGSFKHVTHCIFDMDGLLLDSERVYKQIYQTIVSEHGHSYGGELAYQVLGRPEVIGAELIINHYKLPLTIAQFQHNYHRLQRELFIEVNMMPGAERLLRHLVENNVPIALATSSSKDSFELKTKKLMDVFNLFHHRVLGGSDPDVKKGKPSPDIFLVAASRFPDNPDPLKCLVFEDAPNGVEAALSAGMQVVMVPDPSLPKSFTEKATTVLDSLLDFKPEEFGLPPFKN
ncbi:probable pseudouridine-5'-phosphatase isoform X2 [Belonocnema kinseyi]|uniref:probable pseudouridine-5'-phosphatase isoform X2 n=1 Tax=Belonocnema kinseyi TaxID=2817044 RepID=UPI00143CD525|nr:probable pseudouridine-5'-phosphatase isoform X2 [Belonocnema kinseyi]